MRYVKSPSSLTLPLSLYLPVKPKPFQVASPVTRPESKMSTCMTSVVVIGPVPEYAPANGLTLPGAASAVPQTGAIPSAVTASAPAIAHRVVVRVIVHLVSCDATARRPRPAPPAPPHPAEAFRQQERRSGQKPNARLRGALDSPLNRDSGHTP